MADPLTPEQIGKKTRLIKQGLYWEALDLPHESSTKDVVLRIAGLRQSANNNRGFVDLLNAVKKDLQSGNYSAVRLQVWEGLFPKLSEAVADPVLGIDEEDISREAVWGECISQNLSRSNGEVVTAVRASLGDKFRAAAVALATKAQEHAPPDRLQQQNVTLAIRALKKSIFCLELAKEYANDRQNILHNLRVAEEVEGQYEAVARLRGYGIPTWPGSPARTTPPPKKGQTKAAPTPTRAPSTPQIPGQKSKFVAVVLALFFGPGGWLYTYGKDKHKFWISVIIMVSITISGSLVPGWVSGSALSVWIPLTWAWPVLTAAARSREFYRTYPNVGAAWLRKSAFSAVLLGGIGLVVLFSVVGGTSTTPAPTTSLGEAVDNAALTWSTGGNAEWFGQTTTYYYGGDAARSGVIRDNQATWLRATVTGPGTLTFYWKVSSESNYDFLRFYIGDVEQTQISGSVDWQQKTYSLTSGTHTLQWKYAKDSSRSSGSDCGWLDKVEFTSTSTPSSPLILQDDFSNPGSGWYVGSNDEREMAYKDGEYSMLVKESNYSITTWNLKANTESNFTAEVDVRAMSTVAGSCAGIMFRHTVAQDGEHSHYLFYVRSSDGAYRVRKWSLNKWIILADWTKSSYIKTGTAVNHLKVVCRGSQIEIYANGQKLTTVTDSSLTSGYVGVVVETTDQPNAHYHFDGFKLYELTP